MFELSRVRDEHQFQRNADLRQGAELQKANANLERIRAELDAANAELQKKVSEAENRFSTRKGGLPPQGPPPTAPLPPLPASALPSPIFKSPSFSDGDASTSTHRSSGSTALTSIAEIGAAVAQMPDNIGQVVQKVVAERDSAVSEREILKVQLAMDSDNLHEAVSYLDVATAQLTRVLRRGSCRRRGLDPRISPRICTSPEKRVGCFLCIIRTRSRSPRFQAPSPSRRFSPRDQARV